MILCICANPALDYIAETDELNIGGVNRARSAYVTCGGKGVNFAAAAQALGLPTAVAGFTGDNSALFDRFFDKAGVRDRLFLTADGAVRVNVKLKHGGAVTEINGRGFSVPERLQDELIAFAAKNAGKYSLIAACGSVPRNVPDDFYYKLASAAKLPFACDCDGGAMTKSLAARPVLIKPKTEELARLADRPLTNYADIVAASRAVIARGAVRVLASMGADGAILTDADGSYHARYTLPVTARAACGGGDAMFAAACGAVVAGAEATDILTAAVAAGTAAISCAALTDITPAATAELKKNIQVERL